MPLKKLHLNASEEQEYIDALRRLKAAKCHVEIPDQRTTRPQARLTLEQLGQEFASVVYDMPGTLFILAALRIVTNAAGVRICDYRLQLPFEDCELDLASLADMESAGLSIAGINTKKFEVLNPWFEERICQKKGEVHEGVIIAKGATSLPNEYAEMRDVAVKISIIDQFKEVVSTSVRLTIDRSAIYNYKKNRMSLAEGRRSRSRGLFERDEPLSSDAKLVQSKRTTQGGSFHNAFEESEPSGKTKPN